MSNRKHITPECPNCGTRSSRVRNTYYTDEGNIIRSRHCKECPARWYTTQYPEEVVDPGVFRVYIPNKDTYPEDDPRSRPKYCEITYVDRQK